MLRKLILLYTGFLYFNFSFSQDTTYARGVIKFLTSKKCFGRGYLNKGLQEAESFIVQEIKKQKALTLFEGNYTQSFYHQVNTFPSRCEISINDQKLIPGVDFILNPSSSGIRGHVELSKIDSNHYTGLSNNGEVSVVIKNKLTYSVAHQIKKSFEIELKPNKLFKEFTSIDINVKNAFNTKFRSKNIGCFIEGSSKSDSCIVFSAHYDHLGGMGSETYFPGANDNASGVSAVLNLMKYYSKNKPNYKTVFLFFAGEEAGLLGSKYFVESKAFDLKKIKFLINLDLLGTGDEGIMVVNGAIHEKEFTKLNEVNDTQHLVKQIKKRGKAANSDHYWFSEAGVPCFFIYTMGGISAYHDVFDVEKTLPLTDYVDVCTLIIQFINVL